MAKKIVAEFIGTFTLVLFGCGTAVFVGCEGVGLLITAIAFGLSIVAAAYAIGDISGCHINPAVSLAMLICKRMSFADFIGYVAAQVAGAFAATGIIKVLEISFGKGMGYGANSAGGEIVGSIVLEAILTFVFVLTILGVTEKVKTAPIAPLAIGLTLTMVHIIGIPFTGTSVNPARSLAPAVLTGGAALSDLWVFIVAPLAGAAIAAILFRYFSAEEKK